MSAPRAVRAFLIDDHPVIRGGLTALLEQAGVVVCGQAGDRRGALAGVASASPDLIVLDLSLGAEDGVALLRELGQAFPRHAVVIYSMHEDAFHVERAFAAGAKGYVSKREDADVLLEAIDTVAGGEPYVSPHAARALAFKLARVADSAASSTELTVQERRVYALLAVGATTPEIAEQLHISRRTVESYYGRIQVKLDLGCMRELRQHAIAHGRGD